LSVFFIKKCLVEVLVFVTKLQQKRREKLSDKSDKIKFVDARFETRQVIGFGVGNGKTFYSFIVSFQFSFSLFFNQC